jgi:hypothetical protein
VAVRRFGAARLGIGWRVCYTDWMEDVSTRGLDVRSGASHDDARWFVPRRVALLLLLAGVLLVPWSALLFVMLPGDYTANHWHLAWGGFDVFLAVALSGTAVAVIRGSRLVPLASAATGTLLVCDAWFDVLTSSGVADVTEALVAALLVELPLAAVCFWIAWRHEEAMRPVGDGRGPR